MSALDPALCAACGHPGHEGACEAVTGYDHLNGDHDCGCPGPGLFTVDLDEDPAGEAAWLRSLGLDPKTAERADLLAALDRRSEP